MRVLIIIAVLLAGCDTSEEARDLRNQVADLSDQVAALESTLWLLTAGRERYVCTFTTSDLAFGSHTFNAGDSITFYDLEIRTYPTGFPDPDPRSIALPDWLDCTPE